MLNLISTITPSSFSRAWFSAAHPDLPIIATCFSDKSVRIYSLTSFTLLSTISGGHKRSIRTCSWKPNLKTESVLGTGSFDATVGIWRSSQLAPAAGTSPEDLSEHKYHPESDNEDDDEEWRFAIVLEGHESEVKSISWSAGGNLLATSSRDKSIWIWEEVAEDDFETIAVLQEHEGDVKCVAWHPEEELVASGSYDTDIRLWKEDGDDWGCVEVLRGHSSTVWAIDWEPVIAISTEEKEEENSARLVSCSDDMTIRIWKKQRNDNGGGGSGNVGRWKEEATLPHTHELAIYSVAWGQGGRILSSGADGRLVVYQEIPATANAAVPLKHHNHENSEQSSSIPQIVSGSHSPPAYPSASQSESPPQTPQTEWVILTEVPEAHGVFEINHVCWARRGSSDVIVTSGDDGVIKVWGF